MKEADSSLLEAGNRDRVLEILTELRPGGKYAWLLESAAHVDAVNSQPAALYGDMLYGADQIAEFIYGDKKFRRKVYNLIKSGRLPHFRLGASICARRSVLESWISQQERGG